eukprot:6602948-Prymnesium_polylepis.1
MTLSHVTQACEQNDCKRPLAPSQAAQAHAEQYESTHGSLQAMALATTAMYEQLEAERNARVRAEAEACSAKAQATSTAKHLAAVQRLAAFDREQMEAQVDRLTSDLNRLRGETEAQLKHLTEAFDATLTDVQESSDAQLKHMTEAFDATLADVQESRAADEAKA